MFICRNAEGVDAQLSEMLKGYMVRKSLGTPILYCVKKNMG